MAPDYTDNWQPTAHLRWVTRRNFPTADEVRAYANRRDVPMLRAAAYLKNEQKPVLEQWCTNPMGVGMWRPIPDVTEPSGPPERYA